MALPVIKDQVLQAACDVLADTDTGLTGSEIGDLLRSCSIDDPHPTITKRRRLFKALSARQRQDRCANNVAAFIQAAMAPVRYAGNSNTFELRRNGLNVALAFGGLHLGEDGKLRSVAAVRTLSEAEERASRLRAELIRRQVHPDVLVFCQAELLQRNYFHAVFEATKSVAEKVRRRTGLTGDGAALVDSAFSIGKTGPILALNSLRSESEQSEQKGFANLLKGMFGMFRNTTGHAPRVAWPVNEKEALDILTLVSLLHRRIDSAVPVRSGDTEQGV
jgi:uncharacterized protein (TIGR02391 family)